MRQPFSEMRTLTLAQVRADLEDQVTRRQPAQRIEARKNLASKSAGARTDLQDVALRQRGQDLGTLARDACTKQRRDLGCGDKIAGRTKFTRASAVIAETRRIQRQIHIVLEAEPAAGRIDGIPNMRDHALAMTLLLAIRLRFTLGASSGIVRSHEYPQ